jgi:hypothetical protein
MTSSSGIPPLIPTKEDLKMLKETPRIVRNTSGQTYQSESLDKARREVFKDVGPGQ